MSLLNNQSSCSTCSLQVRIQQLENDNNEMQTNLQQSNEKIAEHDLLLQQTNEFQQMHLALVFERNKRLNLKEENKNLNKEIKNKIEENENLLNKFEKEKENNEELNKKLEENKIKIDKLNSEKENLQANFDEVAIYIDELKNENKYKQELFEKEIEEKSAKLKFEIKKCKAAYLKNAKLVSKNKKLFERIVCMKKIIKAKNNKNIKIVDYINQLKLENENIIEEKDEEINKQKNNYLDQIDQLKLENENLCKNLGEKDEKIKLCEEQIKKFGEENKNFLEEISQLNSKNKNIAKEAKEKEQKIRLINDHLQEANQKNQSLLEDIDQLNSEKRNLITEFKEKIKVINDQLKEANTSSNEKINLIEAKLGELYTNLDKLQNETDKPVHFVKLDNKLTSISTSKTCCKNACINSNVNYGSCIFNKGFVRIVDYLKVEYHSVEGKENNKKILVFAQRSFNKPTNNNNQHLFYFEIKIIEKAENQNCDVGIGLDYNGSYTRGVGSNVGDVYGCALVFPPMNELKKLPFYFCTKNGSRIDGNHYLLKEEGDTFRPFIKTRSCSVEINFGNDLENKPFCYDITKNI